MQYIKTEIINNQVQLPYNEVLALYNQRKELLIIDSLSKEQMYLTPFDYNARMYLDPNVENLDDKKLIFDFLPNCNYADSTDLSFLERFHYTWYNVLRTYLRSPEFFKILLEVAAKRKVTSVSPQQDLMFSEFLVDLRTIKGVWIGESPYPSAKVANGRAFATWEKECPKSLQVLLTGIKNDLYYGLHIDSNDLGKLSQKGIMFLNYSLAIDKDKHLIETFKPFIEEVIKILNQKEEFSTILFGNFAKKLQPLFAEHVNVYSTSHPVSSLYKEEPWDTNSVFLNFNKHIKLC